MLDYYHKPVLLSEVLDVFSYLRNVEEGYFVDGTLGAGGHSLALAKECQISKTKLQIIGIDKDKSALEIAGGNIAEAKLEKQFTLIHDDFKNIYTILKDLKIEQITGALIDLGVSSMQLDYKERGFSFETPEAPLDMRMNQEQRLTAATVLNTTSERELVKIIKELGEERFARSIAKNIALARKTKPIRLVGELLELIKNSIPPSVRFGPGKHWATNTFRALRMVVNDELGLLDRAVEHFADHLAPGAQLAVISFHSLEDRIIKDTFKKLADPCECPPEVPVCACGKEPVVKILTKKPIAPNDEEIQSNPRARSAKLRVVERL